MALRDELAQIAARAEELAAAGEALSGVLAVEAARDERVYLCSFDGSDRRSWLALGSGGDPIASRALVREAVSIAAMCEVAEENAGGGSLDELREQLATLRATEAPEGIEAAEEAALALQETIAQPPRVASPAYLDAVGYAARRLEHALGESDVSPFGEAMQRAVGAVEDLASEVEANYKGELR
ncbi:MAG TPA: hypothetical protein VGF23_03665 [Gaiellaceae bacterium]